MKKTTLAAVALLLALAAAFGGCAENTWLTAPPTELAETASSAAAPTGEDSAENTPPPAELKTPEENSPDAAKALSDNSVEPENPYAGTYRNNSGQSVTITAAEDGRLQYGEADIDVDNKQEDGSILAYVSYYSIDGVDEVAFRLYLYPVETTLMVHNHDTRAEEESDDSRLRLFLVYTDVPDIKLNVYYKVEPLKEGELSYLPAPGFIYEYSYDGVFPASGEMWRQGRLFKYEETENGEVKETLISFTSNGEPADITNAPTYLYFEDASGLYKGAQLVIKYPIKLGETFTDGYTTYEITAVNETITTEAGVFENVVAIDELDYYTGGYITEYYAPGVGHIRHQGIRDNGVLVKVSR